MSSIDSNNIVLKKSHPDCLLDYTQLYSRCFPKAHHFTLPYLKWLYCDNPSGALVGADAFYNDEIVGQVAAIPREYFLNGSIVKGLLAVNVAVHPQFQGRHLFKKLALRMCEQGAAEGYEFMTGVANRVATPIWIRQLGFQRVQPLEACIGVGSLNINRELLTNTEQLRGFWSEKMYAWRTSNPNNPISTYKKKDHLQCYAAAKGKILPAYAEIPSLSSSHLPRTPFGLESPLRLFLGLIPQEARRWNAYRDIPERFKPSPLNLMYYSLNQKIKKLEKDHISFSFLDFDAY